MKRIAYSSINHNFKISHDENEENVLFEFGYNTTQIVIPISKESMKLIFDSIPYDMISDEVEALE